MLDNNVTKRTNQKELGNQDNKKTEIVKGNEEYDNDKKRKTTLNKTPESSRKRHKNGCIRTRTSPRTLHDTIKGMTTDQKQIVKDMGLGSIVEMTVDDVPLKLGFYVVDKLDTKSMNLHISTGSIPISVETVHELLGVPNQGVDLLESPDRSYGLQLTEDWRRQFNKINIRPTDVMNLIHQSNNTDFMFKINFLVLFVNLMADSNSMGSCNVNFVAKLKNDQMMSNINWSRFIFDKLKSSKDKWRRDSDMCFYTGPLTFLTLLYVEATISRKVEAEIKQPALTSWKYGLLRKRETTEIDDGGFGLLPIKSKYTEGRQFVKGECSSIPRIPPEGLVKEEYMKYLEIVMTQLRDAKELATTWIEMSSTTYPDDSSFDIFKAQMISILSPCNFIPTASAHTQTPEERDIDKSLSSVEVEEADPNTALDACWVDPSFVAAAVEMVDAEILKSEIKKATEKALHENIGVEAPSFDLGISPVKNNPSTESVQNTPKTLNSALKSCSSNGSKDKGKKVVSFIPEPITSYIDHIEDEEALLDLEQPGRRAHRRVSKPSDHLRSPYVQRCVDFNITADDKRFHEWALGGLGDTLEYVYWGEDDIGMTRVAMESLAANISVNRRAIDAWSSVLNFDEKYRSRDSPKRYFFNTNLVGDLQMSSSRINMPVMYDWFRQNMARATKNDVDVINFIDIDMVFVPMMKTNHYYLMVFNLKNPEVLIIDNMHTKPLHEEELYKYYGHASDIMQMLMIKHLESIGHKNAEAIDCIGQQRAQMEWQTHHNYEDSGIFTMRAMETFMGDLKNWQPGFDASEKKQTSQIEHLKMKYVRKILTSESNTKREWVREAVDNFFQIPPKLRDDIQKHARNTRWERIML